MKDWTIMVYFAGDNNLSTEMAYALEQMRQVAKENPNINLYVYYDGLSRNVPTLYCDFSDAKSKIKFYRSYNIKDKLIKVKPRFNENSASMYNILNFVYWCVKKDKSSYAGGDLDDKYKQHKYAMIFSGHSFGFMDWGLFKDINADYYMTLSKLRWLFQRITYNHEELVKLAESDKAHERKRAERNGGGQTVWNSRKLNDRTTEIIGKPLDLLGFDSCELSSLEVASQFKGLARTMVASEGSVPNAGWNYAQILLGKIKDHPKADAEEIAVSFVDGFIKQQNKFALADISVVMAAWDLTELDDLESSFAVMVDNLLECFEDENSVVYKQLKRLITHVHWQCQTFLLEQYIDLCDFCQLLIKEIDSLNSEIGEESFAPFNDLRNSCANVVEHVRRCILVTGYSGSDFQYTNGVSLFFPWSLESYISAKNDYKKLTFIKNKETGYKWNYFLRKYLSVVSIRKANRLTPTDNDGNVIITPETISVVYNSYTFFKENSKSISFQTDSNLFDQKRPPDGDKRPPDGDKLYSNISLFVSRFMKLKNFRPSWNQTGFTSTRVKFVPESKPAPRNKICIKIPKGISVLRNLIQFADAIKNLGENSHENGFINGYLTFLERVADLQDKKAIETFVEHLANSELFSAEKTNEDLRTRLESAFFEAAGSVNDPKTRDYLINELNSI